MCRNWIIIIIIIIISPTNNAAATTTNNNNNNNNEVTVLVPLSAVLPLPLLNQRYQVGGLATRTWKINA
jgi:hypothetical protein